MPSANLIEHLKKDTIPIGLSLMCFLYYATFLLKYGDMFYRGSDVVSNAAYAMTMFSEVYRAGWTVPKPFHILLFGSVYWITRDLWFLNLVCIAVTPITVYVGCRLVLRHYHTTMGCIAFAIFMMTMPRMFHTTMVGGTGGLNALLLLISAACVLQIDQARYRIAAIVFLSLANLTRPDSWPSTYLIIFLIIIPKFLRLHGSRVNKSDFLFLIPMGMPLIWMLVDWGVFGDLLYSAKTAGGFARAVLGRRPAPDTPVVDWRNFAFAVKGFSTLFSLSSWVSIRAAVFAILCLAGIATMCRKQPRLLLLLICPFVGSIGFYFLWAKRAYRPELIYYAYVFVTISVSVGLGRVCSLVGHNRYGRIGRFAQGGLLSLALVFLTAGPYKRKIMQNTIPAVKEWAAESRQMEAAITSILDDVNRTAETPIIMTTKWVPGSRIALKRRTGKGIFVAEWIVHRERVGHKTQLPDFEGRTVYFATLERTPGPVGEFLRTLVMKSHKREVIYDGIGLVVFKCFY